MGQASVRIGNLGNNSHPIFHGHQERFAEHPVGLFLNADTPLTANGLGRKARKFVHVELDTPSSHFTLFVPDELCPCKLEEIIVLLLIAAWFPDKIALSMANPAAGISGSHP